MPTAVYLIVLGRVAEAEEPLRKRLKTAPQDHHARLKLAGVLERLEQRDEAIVEYIGAADQMMRDGFLDRAHAALTRGQRIAPLEESIKQRLLLLEEKRKLDQVRRQAVAALSSASRSGSGAVATAAIELEQIWDRLSSSPVVRELPGEQIVRVLSNMKLRRFGVGETLVRAESSDERAFLIAFGEIEALAPAPTGGRDTSLRTFTIGDLLGESSLLERQPWAVSLRPTGNGSVLVLDREGLERCLVGNPDPRALVSGLRRLGNDAELREMCGKLRSRAGSTMQ